MSIILNSSSRIVVQGITGKEGQFHTAQMLEYGTKVVAGVTPGKGGNTEQGVPVFNTVHDAVKKTGANISILFVPPPFAADGIMEAAAAGVDWIICVTEGIPVQDMIKVKSFLKDTSAKLIGPNSPGVISPGKSKAGIMPGFIHQEGSIGILSRSGTLTYEAVAQVVEEGFGQSTAVGIGGDPIIGSRYIDLLQLFEEDDQTEAVLLIGEIGGTAEEEAAAWAKGHFSKPLAAFIAGQTAPPGKRMGHAGAIISGGKGKASDKMKQLQKAGIRVIENPALMGKTLHDLIKERK
ncbi:MAG: succinyl-CoA synthetase alpha subunit [Candidatus Marinimicrobia bacterium]|jgi:succinyl-CoA synthetase alpha subunit|nr:succinyl-CoA synthetase alpha subunit [Candidatus Neomarinimicrobiota bacterium]